MTSNSMEHTTGTKSSNDILETNSVSGAQLSKEMEREVFQKALSNPSLEKAKELIMQLPSTELLGYYVVCCQDVHRSRADKEQLLKLLDKHYQTKYVQESAILIFFYVVLKTPVLITKGNKPFYSYDPVIDQDHLKNMAEKLFASDHVKQFIENLH